MFLVVGLVACGNAREKAAENIIENMAGDDIDVDIDDDGDSITITSDEGEVSIQGDEDGMPWPGDKLPSNVPKLKGVKVVAVIDAGTGVMIGFEDCDNNTANAYVDQIKASGWNVTLEMESEGMRNIIADNANNEFLQFGWDSEDGSGTITYGSN